MTTITPLESDIIAAPSAPGPGLPVTDKEVWEMRVEGTIYLRVLKATRFGAVMEDSLKIGPKRKGHRFEISRDDRLDNQRTITTVEQDPFRNGALARVDGDQQAEAETKSDAVLTDIDELEILDLPDDAFFLKVASLSEIPVRNIRAVAEAAGASHTKVSWLDDHIRERFMPGGPQVGLTSDTKSERLS